MFEVAGPPPIRSRRNPRWIALGIAAVCLGAIASFFLYSQVAHSQQVIAVRHAVHRGETISAGDLGAVRIGETGGVTTVPAGQLDQLVGKVAGVELLPGSLLPPDAVTDVLPPAKGDSVIGIKLALGRAPSGFLAPSSPVRLVVLPADAAAGASSGEQPTGGVAGPATDVATISAVIVNAQQSDEGVFLNLELPADEAVRAASYAAQNRVVVVRESER